MAALLKDIYSRKFYDQISDVFAIVIPGFKKDQFIKKIYTPEFESKELKDRMRHTSSVLHAFFPQDFPGTVLLIKEIITRFRERGIGEDDLAYMFLPDYIENYGIDNYTESIRAIEYITQFVSCEFTVRPFLLKYEALMLKQMVAWSKHENHKVRRLSSEGSRPRLPWAMAVPALKQDPAPILPILENLKQDPSDFVRRSVANSLNDISKEHPGIVLAIANKWQGVSKETDSIIKHGCRTLLKKGDPTILKYYNHHAAHIQLTSFKLLTPKVPIGGALEFSFSIHNADKKTQMVRLEYGIYFLLKNGQTYKKVFKISERPMQPGGKIDLLKKQSFKIITTRTFYMGLHKVSIIINGEEKGMEVFELVS